MTLNPLKAVLWLYRFYFPVVAFDMPLACQRTQAIKQLAGDIVPGWRGLFSAPESDAVGGKVSRRGVALYRIQTLPGRGNMVYANSWRPVLFARFGMRNNSLHLTGHFTVHPFIQAFTSLWLLLAFGFGGYVVVMFFFAPAFGIDEPMPLSFPLTALALIAGGTFLVRLAWRTSKGDIDFISEFLQQRVGAEEAAKEGR